MIKVVAFCLSVLIPLAITHPSRSVQELETLAVKRYCLVVIIEALQRPTRGRLKKVAPQNCRLTF